MPRAQQIAVNETHVVVLADDGRLFKCDLASGAWSPIALHPGLSTKERKLETEVPDTRLPVGCTLRYDVESNIWTWQKGPSTSGQFRSLEDAISDAKQKYLASTIP